MGSRRTNSSPVVFALVAAAAGAFCAYAAGCGSSTTATPSDAGATAETGLTGPFPDAGNLQCSADSTDWPMFGQNVCNTNSQASAGGISVATAPTLGVKWVYAAKGDVSATPSVVAGSVYFPDWGGYINKVDANTGAEIWSKSIQTIMASAGDGSAGALTGFASRNAPVVSGGNVIFGTLRGTDLITTPGPSAYLVAIDQNTAALQWATLLDPHQAAVVAGSPVIDGTTVYIGVSSQEEFSSLRPGYACCSFRGSVVAVDATTGAIKWKAYTIDDSLFFSNDAGKLSGFAGAAVWSSTPVVDRKRHQLYITSGNNYHYANAKEAEAGASAGNYVDSVIAIDTDTGKVKWAQSEPEGGEDLWTLTTATGKDSDFGAGANLFTATIKGVVKDVVGAGQKSGVYWAFDADTGEVLWKTQVGPGGHLGGIHWGTATDGTRIYTEVNFESGGMGYALGGTGPHAGETVTTGSWAALDPSTGNILWQIANPVLSTPAQSGVSCNGPVTVANGVLMAGSMDANGTMFFLDASTGNVLYQYTSGGTVYGGAAISNGVIYWGSGYPANARPLGFGTSSMKLYAFAPGAGDGGAPAAEAGATDAASE